MGNPYLRVALATLAIWSPGAQAACADKTAVDQCIVAYGAFSANTDPAQRCPAWTTYDKCVQIYVAGCADAVENKAYLDALESAKSPLCAAGGLCTNTKLYSICAALATKADPYDSSVSSGSDPSLKSWDAASLHEGSSGSDSSDSMRSSGYKASGSSGSFPELWQWLLAAGLCCFLCGILGAIAMSGRGGKKKKKKPSPKPSPEPKPAPSPKPESPRKEPEFPKMPLLQPALQPAVLPLTPSYVPTAVPQYQYSAVPSYRPGASFVPAPYAGVPQYGYAPRGYAPSAGYAV